MVDSHFFALTPLHCQNTQNREKHTVANFAISGAQWGDEGKGKIVDVIAPKFDVVIRYQGGPNAGHSVVFDGDRFALHVLPSGIFQKHTINVIANGVVVDPRALVREIEGITSRGIPITPDSLKISDRAHLILPYHAIIDQFRDHGEHGPKIGTTGKGIGPAYEWKAARSGLRFCDVADRPVFLEKLAKEWRSIQKNFGHIETLKDWSFDRLVEELTPSLDILSPFVTDTVVLLAKARADGKKLLFEGAQAALLDIDFGTYPFVTSSNASSLGVSAGAGVPLRTVDEVVGIFKAYTSRVGEGPFPSELEDRDGERIRVAGHEFGTTTGRPRRCGWLDLVALNYTHTLNQFSTLAITKLDILDQFDTIKVADSYTIDGVQVDHFPASAEKLERAKPHYREFPGWNQDISSVRTYDELPEAAKRYLDFIESFVGCPIGIVSVGPDREQTILRKDRIPGL